MKEAELREHAECNMCKKKIGESEMPMFAVVEVIHYGINLDAAQRQQGLGIMIGASLAMVMGADEDLATELDRTKHTLCFNCRDKILELFLDE